MENASKALLMAAGVLVGILLISLALYLFISFGSTSASAHRDNEIKQLAQFNDKFSSYQDMENLTIYDVITVAGMAKQNNDNYLSEYNNPNDEYFINNYKIEVILDGKEDFQNKAFDQNDSLYKDKLIKEQLDAVNAETGLSTYKCSVLEYHSNGRIYKIEFEKIKNSKKIL